MAEETKDGFVDMASEDYPFTIEYLAEDTGELLDTLVVQGPGVLAVPSFAPRKVTVRTTFPQYIYVTDSGGNTTQEPLP